MSQKSTGRAGVVSAPSDANSMDKLASAVLDDLLYNVIHDLLMKTHRDEKQARSATAAIRVETMAAEAAQDLAGATGESKPEGHYETDAAIYENGQVTLKSNPLKTIPDILCPRCHLPRLLYPTDGRGARKPEPGVNYCKKHPYIDKPGCDIYGQMWVAPGPGRGKKKKDFDKKVSAAIHAATTGIETPNGNGVGTTTEQRPPNVLSFPSATCSKCKRCILVSRLNNHMGSCIGNSGRNASRAAAQKISNGSSNGHGGSSTPNHDNTPPSSQKDTPLPGSQAASPRKRDADDFDDGEDESDAAKDAKPKKKFKTSASSHADGASTPSGQNLSVALSKKLTLKMKNGSAAAAAAAINNKKQKAKPSSAASFERKANNSNSNHHNNSNDDDHSDYEDDGGDDDDDDDDDDGGDNRRSGSHGNGHGHNGSGIVRSITFKGSAATSTSASTTTSSTPKKKKQQLGSSANAATPTPPKKTTKVPIPIPGPKKVKLINKTAPLSPPASKNGRVVRDVDAGSESSETMSSPRA